VDAMVTWIIADDQVHCVASTLLSTNKVCKALRVVDSPQFRAMIIAANPSITDKQIPHRTNISKRVLKRFKADRVGLREKLKVIYPSISSSS
jgi:hypothetical protein